MNHETSEDTVHNLRDLENRILNDTHERENNIIDYEVEDLLSCINIWKKEMKETQKQSNKESLQNFQTPSHNLSKLLNDNVEKYNITINDNLLKLAGFKNDQDDEIMQMTKDYRDGEDTGSKIISNLNYPIDLSYRRMVMDKKMTKEDGVISESSSDTRYGTDDSDSGNNNYNKITVRLENEEIKDLTAKETKGKKIDPKLSEDTPKNGNYSENKNEEKHVEYTQGNYEIDSFEIKNDKEEEVEEFKEMIGELIEGGNYQVQSELNNEIFKNQMEDQKEIMERQEEFDSELIGDNVDEREEEEEELENEENPILFMNTIEDAIITENDILRYGKSESNLEIMNAVMANSKEKEESKEVMKDATINSQIDQILNNKEEKEEPYLYEKVRGVCYCKSDNSWTAWWTEKGKSRKKAFKLSLYGNDEARRKAIEHRKYVEEMIPDLKEKKVKTSKKKGHNSKITADNNVEEMATGEKKEVNKTEKPTTHFKEEGIYRGTRKRSRDNNEEEGIYFKENAWYSSWINSFGNRVVNSFPVTKEMPFTEAKTKALNSYRINKLNNNNNYYYYNNKENKKALLEEGNNGQLIKKKKNLTEKENERTQVLEHFNILGKKLQEEIEKNKSNQNYHYSVNNVGEKAQTVKKPEIFMENVQEFTLPGREEEKKDETKFKSQHCFIKLEKSVVQTIEKAINKSLNELNESNNTTINNCSNISDSNTNNNNEVGNGLKDEEETDLENISALCITQTKDEKMRSINIIPTCVRRPDDTQLITFVILNS